VAGRCLCGDAGTACRARAPCGPPNTYRASRRSGFTRRPAMTPIRILLLASIALIGPTISHAQVAGSTTVGVSVAELRDVTTGWSAKRTILGQPVYNDKDERVGSIDDIIISPDNTGSYSI